MCISDGLLAHAPQGEHLEGVDDAVEASDRLGTVQIIVALEDAIVVIKFTIKDLVVFGNNGVPSLILVLGDILSTEISPSSFPQRRS